MEHLTWIIPVAIVICWLCGKYAMFAKTNDNPNDDKAGTIAGYISAFISFLLNRKK